MTFAPSFILSDAPYATVCTGGVSSDADFVKTQTTQSREDYKKAYSLDDGRKSVFTALIDEFDQCKTCGWDGYEAAPVTQVTYFNAYRFVEALPYGCPMPTVSAEGDGHITLEWYKNPSRVVSVSISSDGDIFYAALLGETVRRNGREPFLGDVSEELQQIIRRVNATT